MFNIGLFNDSFPPTIDGVANTVINYANILKGKNYANPVVITPGYPGITDDYIFDVYRYPSAKLTKQMPYRVGNPFAGKTVKYLKERELDLLHVHSPFASSLVARHLVKKTKDRYIPTVLTYHTKFEIDIARYIKFPPFAYVSKKFVAHNINLADEVWAVSKGTAESLKVFGFDRDIVIMPNGTDFEKGRASAEAIAEINQKHGIADEKLVFLYCGRMMWYKNIKITLDALKILSQNGIIYKMIFVGDGPDRLSIEKYAKDIGIYDNLIFAGAVHDRDKVKAYFSRADLFLFPSTYDTSGLVVKEAAACGCASALIKGCCAAEDVEDGISGIIADEETPESFASSIMGAIRTEGLLKAVGRGAEDKVYFSWEQSVDLARKRYEIVIENFKRNK